MLKMARHLTVEQLGQVSFFPLHQQSSESQVPSSSPFNIDIDSIADDKDFILSQDFFCSPDYITPDGQYISNLGLRQGGNTGLVGGSVPVFDEVYKAAAAEGATFLNEWFVGCNASHLVCVKGLLYKNILATLVILLQTNGVGPIEDNFDPLWVLKTAKEKRMQRFVHMSTNMAPQVGIMLDNAQNGIYGERTVQSPQSVTAPE
ncbi:unnamed protein product [Camellia sinensis]